MGCALNNAKLYALKVSTGAAVVTLTVQPNQLVAHDPDCRAQLCCSERNCRAWGRRGCLVLYSGCPRFSSVIVTLFVFGSDSSSKERDSSVFLYRFKGKARFRFRFLEKLSNSRKLCGKLAESSQKLAEICRSNDPFPNDPISELLITVPTGPVSGLVPEPPCVFGVP